MGHRKLAPSTPPRAPRWIRRTAPGRLPAWSGGPCCLRPLRRRAHHPHTATRPIGKTRVTPKSSGPRVETRTRCSVPQEWTLQQGRPPRQADCLLPLRALAPRRSAEADTIACAGRCVSRGRCCDPNAAMIDGRMVKTTPSGGLERGHDGAKRLAGRKRHVLVDAGGLALAAKVHRADHPDRDGRAAVVSLRGARAAALAGIGLGPRDVHCVVPRAGRCSRISL